jgi:hypothetical protein
VRREERRLIGWYREQIEAALRAAQPSDYGALVELAEVPDLIRGYEGIKRTSIPRAQARAAELRARIGKASESAFQLPVIEQVPRSQLLPLAASSTRSFFLAQLLPRHTSVSPQPIHFDIVFLTMLESAPLASRDAGRTQARGHTFQN